MKYLKEFNESGEIEIIISGKQNPNSIIIIKKTRNGRRKGIRYQ